MSRIGKKPIEIPAGVEVEIKGNNVKIKGEKGELSHTLPADVLAVKKDNQIIVSIKEQSKNAPALWGLTRALLANCVLGVSKGFEKRLEMVGVGYKANLEGDKILNLVVGFSHPVKLAFPDGLQVKVEKNTIIITGIDKSAVGQFAAKVRAVRPPEPYKGKGIRYSGEKVRRKEGKKAATTAAG